VVRLVVSSLARAADLEESVVDDLKIAVSEACANAVMSCEKDGSSDPVSISWTEAHDQVVVAVSDRGSTVGSDASDRTSGRLGMSMALLGSLVDEFSFEPREEGGMTARLVVAKAQK
jgi:serine/threonine-protein kinase RsbW